MVVSDKEKNRIIEYIKNPINNGLWQSTFKWYPKDDSIIKIIQYNTAHNYHDYHDFPSISYVLIILHFMNALPIGRVDWTYEGSNPSSPIDKDQLNKYLSDNNINLSSYIEKYKKQKINTIYIRENQRLFYFIINKEVAIISEFSKHDSNNYSDLVILSTSKIIVNKIKRIFSIIKCAKLSSTVKLFSPEEKLLSPYFTYMSIIKFKGITDEAVFYNANYNYNLGQFETSIASIGKGCEAILTIIYETLFREKASQGATMGTLINNINSKVKKIYETRHITKSDFNKIIDECKKLEKNENTGINELIRTLKIVSNLLKNEQKYNDNQFSKNEINKTNRENSIFPKYIRSYIRELLRFRNSASHHSDIVLGIHDATRMFYYYTSLYIWWQDNYNKIEWATLGENKDAIIKSLVSINKSTQ